MSQVMLCCEVCKQEKPIDGLMVQAKEAGAIHPEVGVQCVECLEDAKALAAANDQAFPRYFNLRESRERDDKYDRRGKFLQIVDRKIKNRAIRQERSLVCKHPAGCQEFHGRWYIARKDDLDRGIEKDEVAVERLVAPWPIVAKGDLKPLPPVEDYFCEPHMRVFADELRQASGNPELLIEVDNVLLVMEEVARINDERAARRRKMQKKPKILGQLLGKDRKARQPVDQGQRHVSAIPLPSQKIGRLQDLQSRVERFNARYAGKVQIKPGPEKPHASNRPDRGTKAPEKTARLDLPASQVQLVRGGEGGMMEIAPPSGGVLFQNLTHQGRAN